MKTKKHLHAIVVRINMFIGLLSVFGIIIALFYANASIFPYWSAWVREPLTVDNSDIISLKVDTALYNYIVSGPAMFDSGFEEYTYNTETGRTISYDANFGLLQVSEQDYLLIRTFLNIDDDILTYSGSIIPIPYRIQDELVDIILDEVDNNINILPVMLETEHDNLPWRIGTAILILIVLLSITGIILLIYWRDPHKHPASKNLVRFGNPAKVIDTIDTEREAGLERFSKITMTRNWAFIEKMMSIDVMRLDDIVWLYISCESVCLLHIHDKAGFMWLIRDKKPMLNNTLEAFASRNSQIVLGYKQQYQNIWERSPGIFIDEIKHQQF